MQQQNGRFKDLKDFEREFDRLSALADLTVRRQAQNLSHAQLNCYAAQMLIDQGVLCHDFLQASVRLTSQSRQAYEQALEVWHRVAMGRALHAARRRRRGSNNGNDADALTTTTSEQ